MNAYQIIEDGEPKVWLAKTMTEALEIAFKAHLDDLDPEDRESDDEERQNWEHEILQGCALQGEVGNP